ncbi:hypothetical protein FI667_g10904, partial [Globisporangium splendens]
MMNMTVPQERASAKSSRKEANETTDDSELASLMRDGERRRASHEHQRMREARESRWFLFWRALKFLSQVLLEVGRRGLRLIERSVPQYIAFVDRFLVQTIRVGLHPMRRGHTLRFVLLLCVLVMIPYMMYRMQRIQYGDNVDIMHVVYKTRELNEHKIRPHIIVDRLTLDPEETKRRAFLRAGGDGLQTDDTSQRCENTVQGVHILTDSMGYVCTRSQQDDGKPGCCSETDTSLPRIKQFTVWRSEQAHDLPLLQVPVSDVVRECAAPEFISQPSDVLLRHPPSIESACNCEQRSAPRRVVRYVPCRVMSEAAMEGAKDKLLPEAQLELDPYYILD